MALAELIFAVAALAAIVTMAVVTVAALRGRRAFARRGVRALTGAVVGYLMVVTAVSFVAPRRMIAMGAPWCFDDWCLVLDRVTEHPGDSQSVFVADLRLISRARRVSQRANGAWIFLVDAHGARYAPDPEATDLPLDVLLAPGEDRPATRRFTLPAGVRPVGLVTGHGGPYCGVMDLLVAGQAGCLFGKPTMIGLGLAAPAREK
jgi:hypothetical protein